MRESPAACAPDTAEELAELPLETLPLEVVPLGEPVAADAVEQGDSDDVAGDPRATAGRTADPELVAPVVPAVSLPHAVNIPPTINEPAKTSVHEWTAVLLIGTPRQTTPFSSATRATQSYSSNGWGLYAQGIARSGRPRNGPRFNEIANAIPATPLS